MRDTPMSIMAIFAHPDDEVGTGSTLSHYAEQGVIINLVCASRGEAATIYCDDCATRENLAEVRTRELECACRNLGVAELRWLDWPDGGIKDLPRPRSIGQVVRLIREFRPDVIITHPENGLYPHPDHLAVWEITRAAFDAAGDPEQFPGSQAWSPARLYTRAIPQSFFDAAPAFASYRVELKGEQLPFYATPDDAIDVVMEVSCCVEHREAAWECHRSQHNPDGAFSQMPDEVRQAMWESEHFVLAAERVPLPPDGKHDLLAGLDAWSDVLAPEDDEAAGIVRAELAALAAVMQVEQEYLRNTRDTRFRDLLNKLPEGEQEALYVLARTLRQVDGVPGEVSADPRLAAQGLACHSLRARSLFLLAVARHAVRRFQDLAGHAMGPGSLETWAELGVWAQARLDIINEFAETV